MVARPAEPHAASSRHIHAVALSYIVIISSIAAVGIIVGTTFFSTVRVATAHDARHVQYGFPFRWVTQNQSFLPGRTLPSDQSLASPLENPTDTDPTNLAYDFLILGLGPPALIGAGAGLIRTARRLRAPGRSGLIRA